MIWLYRLQQRLAITRNEGLAILTLTGLLLLGVTVRHGWRQTPAHDASTYAKMEARFQAHVAQLPGANRPPDGVEQQEQPGPATGQATAVHINLNTASNTALQQLPGIGPALAARIEAYRDAHGPFLQVDDIVRVRGIGEKTLVQLEPLLYVEDAP